MQRQIPPNIIISRTDSIGDVVLTLPVAKILKDYIPGIYIAFMGKAYTRPVIEACQYVDEFIDVSDFLTKPVTVRGAPPAAILHVFPVPEIAKRAKQLRIPLRIGTANRLYHLTTCNELVRLSRKNAPLHEAQLNLKLLTPFGIDREFTLDELGTSFGLRPQVSLPEKFTALLDPTRYNLILHPKSQGSAREWGLENFAALAKMLPASRYNIFISGTAAERQLLNPLLDALGETVTDITGQLSLGEFISFIAQCDGLIAASTGPLHLAAALGRQAVGIYPPMRPIHPGRWAPLGPYAQAIALDKECADCRKQPESCRCIKAITAAQIATRLQHN